MIRRLISVTFVVLWLPLAAQAEEVTVSDLITVAEELGDRQVTVQGELVGDLGRRGDGSVWTQLNGDSYVGAPIAEGGQPIGGNIGVGVRIPSELAEPVEVVGGYRLRGPVVRLTGIWKYHDPDRFGESYLDVTALEVVEPARGLAEPADWPSALIGLLFIAAAAILWKTRTSR